MNQREKRDLIKLSVLLVLVVVVPTLMFFFSLPEEYQLIEGTEEKIVFRLPFSVSITSHHQGEIKINGREITESGLHLGNLYPLAIQATSAGNYKLNFNLFGIIPLREMTLEVVPEIKVIPGGHSVGVMLQSDGILVVRNSYVKDKQGNKHFPAQNSGLEVGDKLLEIEGTKIENKYHLARRINELGDKQKTVNLTVKKQGGQVVNKEITPVKNRDGYYMLGVYVDDGATGVGTISFYHEGTNYYGALGHMVTDAQTNRQLEVKEGKIVPGNISGIREGEAGQPGEKLGSFYTEEGSLGNIEKNNEFGIYGQAETELNNPYFEDPVPIASPCDIEEGTAYLYTVLEAEEIEQFEVKIEDVERQYTPQQKGLVLKISDQELLEKTGGIIQGMSGSPIVQDDQLVGAVTHVFVNDSTRGYGVLAKWMILESEVITTKTDTRGLAS